MGLIKKNGLKINSKIFEFINKEVLPGTKIDSDDFWNKFEKVVHELSPIIIEMFGTLRDMQHSIEFAIADA